MNISDILTSGGGEKHFSFEVLPPLKGTGTERLFSTIEKFRDFDPAYINITTHHSEFVYRELDNGQYERLRVRRRPGTVAIAAAIQNKFGVPVIPHVICSGATADAIEYELIDLQFLGIENVLLLRGDKARDDSQFVPTPGGHAHTTDLIEQVNRFNDGFFNDGTPIKNPGKKFHYGVACYPEKHEEALNIDLDLKYLKMKQDMGADYAVTQLFYDNQKYFRFVEKARQMGITIPIVPGIKPLAKLSQLATQLTLTIAFVASQGITNWPFSFVTPPFINEESLTFSRATLAKSTGRFLLSMMRPIILVGVFCVHSTMILSSTCVILMG